MSQVRILHVMDKLSVDGSRIAGPARQLAYRLPSYPPERYGTHVCSLRSEDEARDFLVDSGLEVTCLGRSKFDLRALGDLRRLAAEWKPSILHLHGYAAWTFGRVIGRWLRLPVVVQEHFIDVRVPAVQRVADWLLGTQQQLGLAVVEPISRFMTEDRYLRNTAIEVMWNALPVEELRARAAKADTSGIRRSLGIPEADPVIGIVGRLAEMKGHRYFLEAAAKIRKKLPNAHFVIVGAGPAREALEEQARRLSLSAAVRFTGHQADVIPWLAMFDVSVLTSTHGEGFHNVALESLAAGTPVVMTDLDAYRGLYTDGREVLMVPVKDAEATAAAALRLLADSKLARQLLENAQVRLADCSLDAVVGKYLAMYDRVLGGAAAE